MTQASQVQKDVPFITMDRLIHLIIGLGIMFFGRYIPSPSIIVEATPRLVEMGFPAVDGGLLLSISPIGMTVLTIFIAVVYLWGFVDTFWPSLLGVFVLGISGYAPMNAVLNSFLGNPMLIMTFFLCMFASALVKSQVGSYIAQWIMTRPIAEGRPWVFTYLVLLTCYLVAFIDQISAVFLMWPVLYLIFHEVGFKKGDTYVSAMVVNCIMMALLSFASDPIKGGAFYLLGNLYALAASNPSLAVEPLSYASYLFFGVVISLISMFIILLSMRFVFRIDVSPLKKLNIDVIKQNKLPPMTWKQKTITILFLFYATLMLLPGILPPSNPVAMFLRTNMMGLSLMIVSLLGLIQYKGESVANVLQSNVAYPWGSIILIATAFLLGGALTSPQTHFSVFLEHVAKAWLDGLGFISITIVAMTIAIVMTNFCNSVTMGIILAPVLLILAQTYGFSSPPLLACTFYIVLIAACTPAASPFAALLFDNSEWVTKADAMKYSVTGSFISLLVMLVVGLPLAMIIF